jgi:hypothetical protein
MNYHYDVSIHSKICTITLNLDKNFACLGAAFDSKQVYGMASFSS